MKQATLFDGDAEVYEALRNPVFTAKVGRNAALFSDIARLYIPDGSRVLDMTYGLGNFWTDRLKERYDLVTMDLERPAMVKAALERLPFKYDAFDAVVLDPPYAGQGADTVIGAYNYGLVGDLTRERVLGLYAGGLTEADRVLRPGGVVIVKCQDQVRSGAQEWNHISIFQLMPLGFEAVDLFVLVQNHDPVLRHNYQHHARKNHSYAWVFKKAGQLGAMPEGKRA